MRVQAALEKSAACILCFGVTGKELGRGLVENWDPACGNFWFDRLGKNCGTVGGLTSIKQRN